MLRHALAAAALATSSIPAGAAATEKSHEYQRSTDAAENFLTRQFNPASGQNIDCAPINHLSQMDDETLERRARTMVRTLRSTPTGRALYASAVHFNDRPVMVCLADKWFAHGSFYFNTGVLALRDQNINFMTQVFAHELTHAYSLSYKRYADSQRQPTDAPDIVGMFNEAYAEATAKRFITELGERRRAPIAEVAAADCEAGRLCYNDIYHTYTHTLETSNASNAFHEAMKQWFDVWRMRAYRGIDFVTRLPQPANGNRPDHNLVSPQLRAALTMYATPPGTKPRDFLSDEERLRRADDILDHAIEQSATNERYYPTDRHVP